VLIGVVYIAIAENYLCLEESRRCPFRSLLLLLCFLVGCGAYVCCNDVFLYYLIEFDVSR